MEELVQELSIRTELAGSALMRQVRERLPPGATIDAVLDAARLVQIHQQAEKLRKQTLESAIDLVEYLSTLTISDEDLDTLTRILEINSGTWISEKCSHELAVLLKNGMFRSILNLFLKLKTPIQEPPRGCFTWASLRLGIRCRRS
jgi:hypothetical protein